ncbi:MAG: hypothetical protein C6I00_00825 [Nitratiruptor sp.]|nr:hypothetical protein [Nitratiruptor sp.]NPA83413.1 2OG-Fe(II) oxygenase [Campylobacterota bacterium]
MERELVPLSRKIWALASIYELPFKKEPLASPYHPLPFLLYPKALRGERLQAFRQAIPQSGVKAKLRGGGFNEEVRKSLLYPSTPVIEELFAQLIDPLRPEIEAFFNGVLLDGTKVQLLGYPPGGHYRCHSDNGSELVQDGQIVGYRLVAPERKLTTLLFLNEEFQGGGIEFCHLRYPNGKRVRLRPRAGMLLVFPSHGLFAHRVHPVIAGMRLAAVKWWNLL